MKALDLVGQRFGMLVVEKRIGSIAGNTGMKQVWWHCLCDCGGEKDICTGNLRNSQRKSCGCLQDGFLKRNGPEYQVWKNLMARCYNPKDPEYKNYGTRGISVVSEWHKFRKFFTDMGKRPSAKYSIDRIDNDGDYSPENCRWVTMKQQANNRRSNVFIEYLGERRTLSQWADRFGISKQIIYNRRNRGLTGEEALTRPVKDCGGG